MIGLLYIFQAYQYMMRYLLEEWSSMEAELMRPRGLWGPPMGHELDKWQLDMTEGKINTEYVKVNSTALHKIH